MPRLSDLPPQSRRVALLIAKGLPYKAIAAQLSAVDGAYSVRTVEWHALAIVKRLNDDPLTGTDDAKQLAPQQRIIVWVLEELARPEMESEAA